MSFSNERRHRLAGAGALLLFLLLPFLVLYWMAPFVSNRTIGNDYPKFSIDEQMIFAYSIRKGSFPLYIPTDSGGRSAATFTLGEIGHPISWIAPLLPGYWHGRALEWNTFLRLLLLGLCHWALFLFLRRLSLQRTPAFLISFVTVYNLRMLDSFRFGASLENYTALLLLAVAIGWQWLAPTKRKGPFYIFASTYLLANGGHPQWMYYGFLGASLLVLIYPFFIRSVVKDETVDLPRLSRFYFSACASIFLGILASSAHLIPYKFEFINPGGWHQNQGLHYSADYSDNLYGSLCSFINPLFSNVHGSFGGSPIIILAALAPLVFVLRRRVSWPVLCLWLACVGIFLWTLGTRTPFFAIAWKLMPFASSMRVPGRLALLMPLFLMLLLAWLFRLDDIRFRLLGKQRSLPPFALLAVVAFAILALYSTSSATPLSPLTGFYPVSLHVIPLPVLKLLWFLALVSLASLALYGLVPKGRAIFAAVLVLSVLLQVSGVLRFGTWIAADIKTPTFTDMDKGVFWRDWIKGMSFSYGGTRDVGENLNRVRSHWGAMARLSTVYQVALSREDARKRMALLPFRTLVVEGYQAKSGERSVAAPGQVASVELTRNSFSKLVFKVSTPEPAFLVLAIPYTKHWQAFLNSVRIPVFRADVIDQAVRVPAGQSVVEFRYWSSATIAGFAVSCFVIAGFFLYLSTGIRNSRRRVAAMVLVVGIPLSLFVLWYSSLYRCDSLNLEILPRLNGIVSPTPQQAWTRR